MPALPGGRRRTRKHLSNLDTREWSFTDDPANEKTFLVLKGKNSMQSRTTLKEALANVGPEVLSRADHAVAGLEAVRKRAVDPGTQEGGDPRPPLSENAKAALRACARLIAPFAGEITDEDMDIVQQSVGIDGDADGLFEDDGEGDDAADQDDGSDAEGDGQDVEERTPTDEPPPAPPAPAAAPARQPPAPAAVPVAPPAPAVPTAPAAAPPPRPLPPARAPMPRPTVRVKKSKQGTDAAKGTDKGFAANDDAADESESDKDAEDLAKGSGGAPQPDTKGEKSTPKEPGKAGDAKRSDAPVTDSKKSTYKTKAGGGTTMADGNDKEVVQKRAEELEDRLELVQKRADVAEQTSKKLNDELEKVRGELAVERSHRLQNEYIAKAKQYDKAGDVAEMAQAMLDLHDHPEQLERVEAVFKSAHERVKRHEKVGNPFEAMGSGLSDSRSGGAAADDKLDALGDSLVEKSAGTVHQQRAKALFTDEGRRLYMESQREKGFV